MRRFPRLKSLRRVLASIAAALTCVGAQCAWAVNKNTSIFSPASTPAKSIANLSYFVLTISAGIYVLLMVLLVTAIVRYRMRPDDDGTEPPQVFGSNQIELSWTLIPVLIIVVLFLATARMIFAIQDAPMPKSALEVTTIGHQFWWEYRYPKLGIVTANELHIPLSDSAAPRPTHFTLSSADVDHSYWVPRLAGKTDLIPNRITDLWMDPHETGMYEGQCAQFCGAQHAKMLARVYVDTPEQFAAWVKQQQQPAVQDPAVTAGRQEFESLACINCHAVAGTIANGRFGPDLTHLMSRKTIAAGAAENTPENLERWIESPDAFKPGALMPPMHLNAEQLHEVTAYLSTLR